MKTLPFPKGFSTHCRLTLGPVLLGWGLLGSGACSQRAVIAVEICAAGSERRDTLAEFVVPMQTGSAVTDVQEAGNGVPFQADPGDGGTQLAVLLAGTMASDACRRIEVVRGGTPREVEQLVTADRVDEYWGEPAIRVRARNATYYYHEGGSGFASIIDLDGNDWISYRPEGGFEGHYRGIPNIAPPDFHPGRPEGKRPSRIEAMGPLKVRIRSETEDGHWRVLWDILPDFARMTLLSKGPEPYWILYEGTPGGSFDVEFDYWRDSAGKEMPMPPAAEVWNGRLPDPQWVFFGDRRIPRGLFLALDPHDSHWDEFWHRGSGGMTVFGFGRGPKPQWQYLDAEPARLEIGLLEDTDPDAVRLQVESASRPLEYRIGKWRPAGP
ncbi:MAG: hypothetical protein OXN89_17995 [Bryobacterales bacterium]|nr:hypothetical protein [Bryobacterales bacterium]